MEALTLGPVHALTQNTVYALPATKSMLYTDTTAATIQQSNDEAFASSNAVNISTGSYGPGIAEVSAAFIRCTSGNISITLKRD